MEGRGRSDVIPGTSRRRAGSTQGNRAISVGEKRCGWAGGTVTGRRKNKLGGR